MTQRRFEIGDKVNIIAGKYFGCNATVMDYHPRFVDHTYTVREIQSGKLLLHYESELQSMYQHDMAQLKLWEVEK